MENLLRQHRPRRHLTAPRVDATAGLIAAAHPSAAEDAGAAARRFAPELEGYGELIVNRRGTLAGFMTRGETEAFAGRVRDQLAAFAVPEEMRRQHGHWLARLGPGRAFMKLEWDGSGTPARLAAFYLRRRLPVAEAVALIADQAAGALPTAHFTTLARLLGKETVHFVAMAGRPGQPVHYKLYFSQLQRPPTADALRVRLARALEAFAPHRAAVARWAAYHDMLAPVGREQTLFVSLAMTRDGVQPSIKIDYPAVAPDVAVGVLDIAEQPEAAARLEALCDRAGIRRLSYLGVRLGVGDTPVLKGYADFPMREDGP